MPFMEFIANGDLKFLIVFVALALYAAFHFSKKAIAVRKDGSVLLSNYHNTKITQASVWMLALSALSLMLGLMHGFYFIGKAGSISPSTIFQGVSFALITPIFGICLYCLCLVFRSIPLQHKSQVK